MDKAEQERLRKMYEQQKMPTSVIKSKESSGVKAFLKKKDPNLDSLKEKYFKSDATTMEKKSAYKPSDTQFKHYTDVENYIE